jgi:hypothetical protein
MNYRVCFEERRYGQVEVEASSEDEARDKAWTVIRDGGGDWDDAETEYCESEELGED